MGQSGATRVFISYAHESDEHVRLVRNLWLFLRDCGIDAKLDTVAAQRRADWAQWMAEQIREADHVLIVASPAYRRRAEGRAGPDEGRGVQYEARLIRDAVYADLQQLDRWVPVILPGATVGDVPDFLAPASTTVYRIDQLSVAGAKPLLRLLTSQPGEVEPPLGAVPVLPPAAHDWGKGQESGDPSWYRGVLAAYLDGVVDESRHQLPGFLPRGKAASLDQRVRVRATRRQANSSAGEPITGRAYRSPVESSGEFAEDPLAARSWEELRTSARHLVVLADPGLGKSWLMRTEAIRLAQEALGCLGDEESVPIPVPIRADQLAEVLERSIGSIVARQFVARGWLAERSMGAFAQHVDAGQAHLLVDGLDEVPDDETRRRIRAALADWCQRPGERQLILTSRIAGYTPAEHGASVEVELLSFTDEQVLAFARTWGLGALEEAHLIAAVADPAISGMARIPLLLALLCSLAETGEDVPRTRAALYERMLLWFLERPHRVPARSRSDDEALLELAAGIAFQFADSDGGWTDLMPHRPLARSLRDQPSFAELGVRADRLIEQLAVDLGLIVPEGDVSGGRPARYLFVHRTFAEYLAARHLSTLDEQRRWEIIERHLWFDPEWLQVISMLGGLLGADEVRKLVSRLHGAGDDAFGHAALSAIRLLSEHPESATLLRYQEQRDLQRTLEVTLRHPHLRWAAVTALRGVPVLARCAVEVLLGLTEDEDASLRLAAVRSLGGVRTPDPTAHLLARLGDEDEQVAAEAAKSLAGRPFQVRVRDELIAQVFSDHFRVRAACIDTLATLPPAQLHEAVAPYLRADQPSPVRVAAYPVLHGSGDDATPLILLGLADDDPEVAAAAADIVDAPVDPRLESPLLGRLSRYLEYAATQDDVARGGDDAGHRRQRDAQAARAALTRSGCRDPLLTAAYLRLVIDSSDTLADLGKDKGPPAATPAVTTELLQRLRSPGRAQQRAARALRALRPEGIDEDLVELMDSPDRDVVLAALEAARGQRDEVLFARVTALTAHRDDDVRADALEIVIERQPMDLDDALLVAMQDPNPAVRSHAAHACADRHDVRLVAALVECIRRPGELAGVVVSAIGGLRGRADPGVREALLACLHQETTTADGDHAGDHTAPRRRLFLHAGPPPHVAAARALAEVEPEAVVAALGSRSATQNGYEGREAAYALVRCRVPGAVDLLLEMRTSGARKTRIAAYNALVARPFPEDLELLVDRLEDFSPEALADVISAAEVLAARHFRALPRSARRRARAVLAAAIAATAPHDVQ
ncbi:HEAT repeat domain-containing protein [Actinomycetospora aeridis]|uniref:HEAT repeat domain-containing protein n=1 Tax=Actinomycetospora aeridis TaxID=3129231 RepID=A0ABU8N723_9PSEU